MTQTDPITVLEAISDRLIDAIGFLNEDNCYLTDQPVPATMPGGRSIVTVSMGGGTFPHEYFAGGGIETLTEDGSIIITAIVTNRNDRPGRRGRRVGVKPLSKRNEPDGNDTPTLLEHKRAILRALLVEWEPQNDSGLLLLRDQLAARSSTAPSDVRIGETMGTALQLQFSAPFDWDLS